jgi:hypothetical protein
MAAGGDWLMLTVCAFYWEDSDRQREHKPTVEQVRIWRNMVERNLTIPHRIVCVTHRPDKINFMPTKWLEGWKHVPGTCMIKLQAHRPGGVDKEGDRVLLMDIDCVVTGNLDALIDRHEDYVFWKNPNHDPNTKDGRARAYIQGSMQLFTVGATEFLWRDFDVRALCGRDASDPSREVPPYRDHGGRFGGAEQAWIAERLNTSYPEQGWEWNVPVWTEADGVYGAGRLFNGKMGNGVQTELPENARIVFTPGDRSPSQPEMVARHPWIREHYW